MSYSTPPPGPSKGSVCNSSRSSSRLRRPPARYVSDYLVYNENEEIPHRVSPNQRKKSGAKSKIVYKAYDGEQTVVECEGGQSGSQSGGGQSGSQDVGGQTSVLGEGGLSGSLGVDLNSQGHGEEGHLDWPVIESEDNIQYESVSSISVQIYSNHSRDGVSDQSLVEEWSSDVNLVKEVRNSSDIDSDEGIPTKKIKSKVFDWRYSDDEDDETVCRDSSRPSVSLNMSREQRKSRRPAESEAEETLQLVNHSVSGVFADNNHPDAVVGTQNSNVSHCLLSWYNRDESPPGLVSSDESSDDDSSDDESSGHGGDVELGRDQSDRGQDVGNGNDQHTDTATEVGGDTEAINEASRGQPSVGDIGPSSPAVEIEPPQQSNEPNTMGQQINERVDQLLREQRSVNNTGRLNSARLREFDGGNHINLLPFINPIVPGPVPDNIPGHSDGWDMIDMLGAWECGLSHFRTLEFVPFQHREKWARAQAIILRRVLEATTEQEQSRALKWWLLSPQVFLREPKRGGRKGQGNSSVNARFDCLVNGDWGHLLTLLQADKLGKDTKRSGPRQNEQESSQQARLRKTVLTLLARGQVGRAVRRITSHGVASHEELWVMEALRSKYPERGRNLPGSVSMGKCLDSLSCLKESILDLETGVAPGFGGLGNEHLRTLAEVWGEEEMSLLESFSLRYLNAELEPWFYRVWESVMTVPLFKTEDKETLRPVGVKSSLIRTLHKRVVRDNRAAITSFLEPQQVALSKAGGFKLVHAVRMMAEENRDKPDWVVVKVDMANAHNEVSRASVIEALEDEPELSHLALHAAVCLAAHHGLEVGGNLWGESGEGMCQGDPLAGAWFCVAWHRFVRELDASLAAVGGMARFGNDDGYLVGPSNVVFPALKKFADQVEENCLLRLQVTKTEVFSWSGLIPSEAPQDIARAGAIVGGLFCPGFICYGIPVGSDSFVRHMLDVKVEEIKRDVERVKEVLIDDRQDLWTILHCSLAQKLDWHLSLCYPSDIKDAAMKLDDILWQFLEHATNLHIPKSDEGLGVECVLDVPELPTSLQGRSYQHWIVRQPVKMGGLGLRSLTETSSVAFVGGVEMSLPHLTGDGGICLMLDRIIGRVEGPSRWSDFLSSNTRTSNEFVQSWGLLRLEAAACLKFLGKDLSGPLAVRCQEAGDESTDGSTRRKVVEQREGLRHEILTEALSKHQCRGARPVTAFPNYDKLSGAWLLALPGPHNGLTSKVFSEAMAAHLCLPSPAVVASGWVGQTIGRRGVKIDPYGDSIMCCNELPGDSWRT